jgi:hypothetical protein
VAPSHHPHHPSSGTIYPIWSRLHRDSIESNQEGVARRLSDETNLICMRPANCQACDTHAYGGAVLYVWLYGPPKHVSLPNKPATQIISHLQMRMFLFLFLSPFETENDGFVSCQKNMFFFLERFVTEVLFVPPARVTHLVLYGAPHKLSTDIWHTTRRRCDKRRPSWSENDLVHICPNASLNTWV